MNEIANQLVQSLFKKDSLQDCSRWELEILAEHYPYFGIAQLLVSGKLKEENAEGYEKQVQKTSLYFNNPFWLNYILNNKTFPSGEIVKEEKGTIDKAVDVIRHDTITEDVPDVDKETIAEENHVEQSAQVAEVIVADVVEHSDLKQEEVAEEVSAASPEVTIPNEEVVEEFKIAPMRIEPLPDENTPTFEPFHTVDYFASQGIKLSLEEKPVDRFCQQLKSFTQWLKTIKKAPIAESVNEAGKAVEQKVVTLAEHSIEDREIVTETMAEVWVKQGNRQKAIEVYNKLSLQNPAKSSYFASLIEQLNQH
jgi:hypothetical protein